MKNVESLYEELKPVILKSRMSIKFLSTESHASRVTIWRWLNNINTHHPDPFKVYSVLKKISGKGNPTDVANHFGGEIRTFLLEYFNT